MTIPDAPCKPVRTASPTRRINIQRRKSGPDPLGLEAARADPIDPRAARAQTQESGRSLPMSPVLRQRESPAPSCRSQCKNAINDARPIATPAGELKKKITIGGPPIPERAIQETGSAAGCDRLGRAGHFLPGVAGPEKSDRNKHGGRQHDLHGCGGHALQATKRRWAYRQDTRRRADRASASECPSRSPAAG